MQLIDNLALGFQVAFSVDNLLYCLVGCLVGTLIGVLPGIGPVAAISMLLPTTFYLPPIGSLIMLAGIYYGAQYGGSTTSILVNIPGEASSIVTCIDGYQMARNGRAGAALTAAALASFFAGCVCTLLIAVAAPPLSAVALSFGAPEYFSLMFLGLTGAVVLARGSLIKAIGMLLLGLLFGLVGTDLNSGQERYTFGLPVLADGIGFVPIALGMLGVAEIISNLEERTTASHAQVATIDRLRMTFAEFKQAWPAAIRGTGIGALLGMLPGGGALLASFASYAIEKKIAKAPSRFGQGAIEGVAGPEAANNAGAQMSFIPLLTLGIPSTATMALMLGAMTMQGIAFGPRVMTTQPQLFWGVIASMWIGNAMLVVLNLPLIGIWVKLLKIPYRMMFPAIVLICAIGGFSLNNSIFEIGLVGVFGFLGYYLRKIGCEPAPLALGFILGPLLEENLRRALLFSRGDPLVFVQRPISAVILVMALVLVVMIAVPVFRRTRDVAFQED